MAERALNREESLGLALAVLGHGALVAWLVLYRPAMALPPPPARMEVTISDETGPISTSPEPQAAPAPDKGPVIGEAPPPPVPEALVKPEPAALRPVPASSPKAPAKPSPPKVAAKLAPITPKVPPRTTGKRGASVLDPGYNDGISPGPNGKNKNPPAIATGPQKMAINNAIWREIRPFWQGKVPQGLDTDKIVSYVKIQLNPDGSLAGTPVLVRQEGVNAGNRQQAKRHGEEAIKAIIRAASFDLPPQFYAYWKSPPEIKFWKSNAQ